MHHKSSILNILNHELRSLNLDLQDGVGLIIIDLELVALLSLHWAQHCAIDMNDTSDIL